MRIALIQMNSRTAARDENVERACAFIETAMREKPNIVVLPEFFNNEYFPQFRDYRYMDYAEPDDGPTQTAIRAQARSGCMLCAASLLTCSLTTAWCTPGISAAVSSHAHRSPVTSTIGTP